MYSSLLASLFLLVSLVSSTQHNFDEVQYDLREDISTSPTMSNQRQEVIHSESAEDHVDEWAPHDSDDEPMVYEFPRDYATSARQERDRLIAEGADPESVILGSEVHNHIPRREGESPGDFAKRYSETMNAMIGRGVMILNDQCTADVVASGFGTEDGRFFDLGPGTGVTKGEFREFRQWFSTKSEAGQEYEVPEKWLKFEKPAPE